MSVKVSIVKCSVIDSSVQVLSVGVSVSVLGVATAAASACTVNLICNKICYTNYSIK